MPRWRKRRRCRGYHGDPVFKPASIPMRDLPIVDLEMDELEAMRLCDWESKTQEEAGSAMGVSRGTVQRLLTRGRFKVVDFIVKGAALRIVPPPNHPYQTNTDEPADPNGRLRGKEGK